jgi:LysR family transcriptional regulator, regulator for metE and metH
MNARTAPARAGDRVALEVRHLKLVRAIVVEGGVTRAAARLHLSQPALSRQLSDLEARLGTPLFTRQGRRMFPTPGAQRLLRAAETVLEELARAEEELRGFDPGSSGTIRLSTECYTAYHWLPRALDGFARRFPRVDVQIVVEATRRPLDALADGRLDLAIVKKDGAAGEFVRVPLFEDEMVAVVAPRHRLARARAVRAKDIAPETLLHYSVQPSQSDVFSRFLGPAGVMPARVLNVELTEAILELVRAQHGVAILASWAVQPDVRAGRVVARPLAPERVRRYWYAAARPRQAALPYVREFIEQVRKTAPRLSATRGRRAGP